MNFSFILAEREYRVNLEEKDRHVFRVTVGNQAYDVSVEFVAREELLLNIDGKVYNVVINSNSLAHWVYVNGRLFRVEKQATVRYLGGEKLRLKKRDVKITMPGRVVQVMAGEGEEVQAGQPILVLEAMKMQNEIKSPQAGKLVRIHFRAGDYVEAGATLFSVE